MQPTHDRSAPSAGQSTTIRRGRIDRADAARRLRATLNEHGPQMWHVAVGLVGEPYAREVVAAAAYSYLRSPGPATERADLLTAVCDFARPMPDAGGPFGSLPDWAREAYVLTHLGQLTYAETAYALRTTPDEIRAACRTARDHLVVRTPAPPALPSIDRLTRDDEVPSEGDHA